mgnify:CR=1 FL=1
MIQTYLWLPALLLGILGIWYAALLGSRFRMQCRSADARSYSSCGTLYVLFLVLSGLCVAVLVLRNAGANVGDPEILIVMQVGFLIRFVTFRAPGVAESTGSRSRAQQDKD